LLFEPRIVPPRREDAATSLMPERADAVLDQALEAVLDADDLDARTAGWRSSRPRG
jgi:hypothetical protein